MNSLFFFSHQDDEFGVYQSILNEVESNTNVLIYYFTTGALSGSDTLSLKRNLESVKVLKNLGVHEKNIFFVGSLLKINDQEIVFRMADAYKWLSENIKNIKNIKNIYVHSYEGGHIDHDSLHLIISQFFKNNGMLHQVYQFSLYHSKSCPKLFFKALNPLAENGKVKISKIKFINRFYFLSLVLNYRSQFLTFFALFPYIAYEYCFHGREKLQKVNIIRFPEKPYNGAMFYEKRAILSWEIFKQESLGFMKFLEQHN